MFQEFPKWLHFEGKESVLVQDAEAEALVMDETADAPPSRDDLIKAAEDAGITVDGRWSDKRLAEEISQAG